ncbi:MAG: glucosaminidase domain-containing protein [Clostridia bacterium]|nr:glucosaminidase domain-containing protein [Clostridia bacterium]
MNMITSKKTIASMIIAILVIGLTTPIFAATKTATVKSQTLMYSSKSTSSTEKAQICAGQKVYVLNTDGNWCNVKWEAKGYAHKNYVNKSNGAVIKGGPNINSEPKKGSTRYGDLRNGNVTFLDNKKLYGDYYKVSITVTGYVQKSALNMSSTGSSSTGNNKPSSSSSSSGSILAALLRLTVKGAEKGAELTLKAFSGLLGRLGRGDSSSSTAKPEYNLVLNKTNIEIKEGSTEKITATYKERTAEAKYKSSDTSVATVSSSGVVKGIKKGNATITATFNGKKATAKVTVSAKAQDTTGTSLKNTRVNINSIVKTDDANALPKPTKSQLEYIIKNASITRTSQNGRKRSDNLMENIDTFMYIQENYNVNAIFAIAVAIQESSAGNSSAARNRNNWFGIMNENGTKSFKSAEECIIGFGKLISGNTYFKSSKTSIYKIGNTYCDPPENWIKAITSHMNSLYRAAEK